MLSKSARMSKKHTGFVFTVNNPKIGGMHKLLTDDRVSYLVYQLEKETIEHIQGYVEFKGEVKFMDVKETMGRAWYSFRYGTREQARNYCMKESTRVDGPWELGVWVNEIEGEEE
tara:strand:- start:4651 stop:4995 length:345 start_codon:yes stop_codon:yes gene_type:complete